LDSHLPCRKKNNSRGESNPAIKLDFNSSLDSLLPCWGKNNSRSESKLTIKLDFKSIFFNSRHVFTAQNSKKQLPEALFACQNTKSE
jgi:hypothetical protein